jgi:hypothetical protein
MHIVNGGDFVGLRDRDTVCRTRRNLAGDR